MITKKIKCEICKTYRADRFCLRKAKNICWHCCNEMRVDGKCPQECEFSVSKKDNRFHLKVYSQEEYLDFFEKEANNWAIKPQPIWDNKSPIELLETKEGKNKIEEFFKKNKIPFYDIAKIYKDKFNINSIDLNSYPTQKTSPEETAKKFLDAIILQDKEAIINFLYHNENSTSNEKFIKRIFKQKQIKKLKKYYILNNALSKNKETAIVNFEINGKYDLSIELIQKNKTWLIKEVALASSIELIGRTNIFKELGNLLSSNKLSKAYGLLEILSKKYFTSAEVDYLYSVYYSQSGNLPFAIEKLESAVALEPEFLPYQMQLSILYIQKNQLKKAEILLKQIINKDKKNIPALNNLANLYAGQKEYSKAKQLFEKCLEIDPNFKVAKDNLKLLDSLIP